MKLAELSRTRRGRNKVPASGVKKSHRIRTIALVAACTSVISVATAAGADASSGYYATSTGWNRVCADTLTMYNNGYVKTFHYNDSFYIDHFAGDNHVWGEGYSNGVGYYGWVYNGWFCNP